MEYEVMGLEGLYFYHKKKPLSSDNGFFLCLQAAKINR